MEEQELKSRPKTQSLTYFTGVDSLRIPDHLHLTTIAPKLEAIGRWYLVKTLQCPETVSMLTSVLRTPVYK